MHAWKQWLVAGCLLGSTACVPNCSNPQGGAGNTDSGNTVEDVSSSSEAPASSTQAGSSSSSGGTGSSAAVGDGGAGDGGDAGPAGLSVADLVPGSGICAGGFRVRITGAGFRPSSQVFFGDAQADQLLLQNQGSVTVRVPPLPNPAAYDVKVVNRDEDGGEGESATLANGFTCFEAVKVTSVSPLAVPTAGGSAVTITGSGFGAGQVVLLGGRAATGVMVAADGNSLTAIAPPGVAGRADVEVVGTFGGGKLGLGILYVAPLVVEQVDPGFGPPAGGNLVHVRGSGFMEDARVKFGSTPARVVDWAGADGVLVEVPAGSGIADVRVEQSALNQSVALPAAYRYVQDAATSPALIHLAPVSGPTSGGTRVHLFGRGFNGLVPTVKFGAFNGTNPMVEDDGHISVTAPAAMMTGSVDVTLSSGTTSLTLPLVFSYVTGVQLLGLNPQAGPDVGGTQLTITGTGFVDGCQFTLGGIPLIPTIVNPTSATATTPPGSPGAVDLWVSCPGNVQDTKLHAFTYGTGLTLLSVSPIRGALSGGTLVQVRGTGFLTRPNMQVLFDATPGTGVEVVGDNTINVYSPPHGAGLLSMTVKSGTESATRDRSFTYYDPSFIVGGVRGGPINGSVNITAIDWNTRFPISEVLVVLGSETGSQYTGFTDERGQVTLSGPDVFGVQTVTAAHCNYTYETLASVNAADITLYMSPLFPPRCGTPSPPTDPPPMDPLPPAPVISGKVTGFAKELFDPANLGPDEVAAAFVFHTWPSIYSQPPRTWQQAPTQVVFVEGGQYVIPEAWHTGPMAIVAMAGIYNLTTNAFRATQLGFHRGLTVERGGIYENRDVVLSVPLTKRVTIQFPDAPYVPSETMSNFVYPLLNLGGEGVHPVFGWDRQGTNNETQYTLENFAQAPGDLFQFYAAFGAINATGLPSSAVLQDGEGPLGNSIALGPLMGYPEFITPAFGGAMNQRTVRIKTPVGQRPSFYMFSLSANGVTWNVTMDGSRTKFILPRFEDYLTREYAPTNIPPGAVTGDVQSVYSPGFDFGAWSYLDIYNSRRSWSTVEFKAVNAGN